MKRNLIIVLCLSVIVLVALTDPVQAQEAKKIQITGKAQTSSGTFADLAAITVINRGDSEPFDVNITGNSEDTVSGYNHDLGGAQLSSGHVAGLATDTNEGDIVIDADMTLEGVPNEQYNSESIDVAAMVNAYKSQADMTLENQPGLQKWGTSDSIGSPSDYKIVYLHNIKMQLEGDFTGYGLLIIEDDHNGAGMAELRLYDNAKWYGVIIVYAADTEGQSDKIFINVGKPGAGSMRTEPSFIEKALAFFGFEPKDVYAAKEGDDDEPEARAQVLGAILVETRQVDIDLDDGDILYCAEAVGGAGGLVGEIAEGFEWEEWREIE
ncbi:MAG: hypothetical protein JW844_00240 [Candidatus Omnitrophica bacterium]|nr:hypothetical protein [Candidatus Omnitrophota bacterium]